MNFIEGFAEKEGGRTVDLSTGKTLRAVDFLGFKPFLAGICFKMILCKISV
mgnify:CR=1 FL=1